MITFDPPVSMCPLANVDPGSIIRVVDRIGFCGRSPDDPEQKLMLITLYTEFSRFRFRIPDQSLAVVNFGSKLIVRPAFESFESECVPPGRDATTELFIVDGVPTIAVHTENYGVRLLNLNSGAMGSSGRNLVSAFKAWTVGVALSSGKFHPLMFFGKSLADELAPPAH